MSVLITPGEITFACTLSYLLAILFVYVNIPAFVAAYIGKYFEPLFDIEEILIILPSIPFLIQLSINI